MLFSDGMTQGSSSSKCDEALLIKLPTSHPVNTSSSASGASRYSFLDSEDCSVTRFAKISLLWQNFISLWQFLDGIRVFGKMVVLWQIVNAIGQILIDVKSAKF